MKKNNSDAELNFIENNLKKHYGYDDESLLRVWEEAMQEWEQYKAANPEAAAQSEKEADISFNLLMKQAAAEHAKPADERVERYVREEGEEGYIGNLLETAEDNDYLLSAESEEIKEPGDPEDPEAKTETDIENPKASTVRTNVYAESIPKEPAERSSTEIAAGSIQEKPEECSVEPEHFTAKKDQTESAILINARSETAAGNVTDTKEKETTSADKIKPIRKNKRRRKVVILAAAVAVMVIGGGIVATATTRREYRYELIQGEKTRLIRHNTVVTVGGDKLEDAYNDAKKKLDIPIITLGYKPKEMRFYEYAVSNRVAVFEFEYNGKMIYLQESLNPLDKDVSTMTVSDRSEYQEIENYWLNKSFILEENQLGNGTIEYSVGFSANDAYYYVAGVIEKDEFISIVENLCYIDGSR